MAKDERRVAIVGAGPAGLVAARFLKSEGFAPVLFEQGRGAGGQWDHTSAASGVWPGMRANTSRILTRFSDLDYPDGTPAFPHEEQVRRYLDAYARQFNLLPAISFGTAVDRIEPDSAGGYVLATTDAAGLRSRHGFSRVVVATGRYNADFQKSDRFWTWTTGTSTSPTTRSIPISTGWPSPGSTR
jgi:dimethylaniline monooxygenase (N-oxide forming)